jgi:predicted TIM-barrel fold metal-dependent hydrolase
MIGSSVFDRHPKLQVMVVHMGGELASILGRFEFTWRLNYNEVRNPPAGKPYKKQWRSSSSSGNAISYRS